MSDEIMVRDTHGWLSRDVAEKRHPHHKLSTHSCSACGEDYLATVGGSLFVFPLCFKCSDERTKKLRGW